MNRWSCKGSWTHKQSINHTRLPTKFIPVICWTQTLTSIPILTIPFFDRPSIRELSGKCIHTHRNLIQNTQRYSKTSRTQITNWPFYTNDMSHSGRLIYQLSYHLLQSRNPICILRAWTFQEKSDPSLGEMTALILAFGLHGFYIHGLYNALLDICTDDFSSIVNFRNLSISLNVS